ncbi:MAG: LysR family transcriptional regulator [Rhodospirillales bacterium]|nr:LysR family transcriptional regulator [Rhodospirillales bacterium]
MDAADLRIFAAVARSGSMSKAAAELGTVQSNVTARIRALEERLGVDPFERTHRGATLTAAGLRLRPFADRVAGLLEDARHAVTDDGTPAGNLVVGSLETTAALRLSPVLAEFVAAYPAVDLSLRTGTTHELIEQTIERRLDGAFVSGPVDHADLVAEPFFREELVVLTAPDAADFEALARQGGLRIIVLRAGCSYRQHLEALLARRGIAGVRHLEFGTLEAIVSCVGAGLGVTLLPEALIGPVWRRGRVRVHDLPPGEGEVETVFIRHRDAYASSALRAFLDCARPMLAHHAAE